MSFDIKLAAQELLKVAETIEKEASEKTFFVCEKCQNKANLATINDLRNKLASEEADKIGKEIEVKSVTVNNVIACSKCGGEMSYEATEESERFYVEDKTAADAMIPTPTDLQPPTSPAEENPQNIPPKKEDKKEDEFFDLGIGEDKPEGETPAEGPTTDDIFSPVDETNEKNRAEQMDKVDQTEDQADTPMGAVPSAGGDTGKPQDAPIEPPPPIETPTEGLDPSLSGEAEKPKPKKKKKEIELPMEQKPKFEVMPKEASERFTESVARYSVI